MFSLLLSKWIMTLTPSVACECGAEKQTVDQDVQRCPIYRLRYGVHRLMVLHDETINNCLTPTPRSSKVK